MRPPPCAGEEQLRQTLLGEAALLDRLLADWPYLCGDRITLADIPAGTMLYRYYGLEITRPAAPNVDAWYARLRERPAYAAHVMVPFEELKGRLAF